VNHYTYRAEWSSEHGEYVGRCLELPWLSQWAPRMQQAIASVEQAVDEYIADREEDAPPQITERQFSGKFVVRTSPALHSRLTVEAAEQNVSLNQWDRAVALWNLGPAADWALRPLISHAHRIQKTSATRSRYCCDWSVQKPEPCTSCPGFSTINPL
jgi:predicted HicB family RNase H-like nuclease